MTERVVVVCGGGGAKAAAHIGVLKALDEAGLSAVHYIGTSMGSVMAAMFAAGLGPREALERVKDPEMDRTVKVDLLSIVMGDWARHVLRPDLLRQAIARLVTPRRFEDLPTPLTVTTADLDTCELVLFGEGGESAPLHDVLYASCALPIYYPPLQYRGRRLADGGLRAILPIELALRFAPTLVVAVDVGPGINDPPPLGPSPLPPLIEYHGDALGVLLAGQAALTVERWRAEPGRPPLVYIRPRIERGATFKVDQVERYAAEGYRSAQVALADLQSGQGTTNLPG